MSDPTPSSQERAVSPVRRPSAGEAATPDDLVERVSSLVREARESIASYANATLTLTYWQVGALIDSEVLGGEARWLRVTDSCVASTRIDGTVRERIRPAEPQPDGHVCQGVPRP